MGLHRGWQGGGLCAPSLSWIRVCMRIMPLSVSVEFLCLSICMSVCLSVYQSVFLSKSLYLYMPVCLHVSLSPPSLSPSPSLSICGVDLADQGSRARYRAIQVFSRDSKSVPFPINMSW